MNWAYAHGKPKAKGVIRSQWQDFVVTEELGFELSGEGEHLWVEIEKQGLNSQDVIRLLAKAAGIPQRQVGHSGLKDKHGVTRQWLSLWLPGKAAPDLSGLESEQLRILQVHKHNRKLRPGSHRANGFILKVRELADAEALAERLALIQAQGVPNYFGEQRFGFDNHNLELFRQLVDGQPMRKNRQSMAISAARSWLFNQVVSRRIEQGLHRTVRPGDCLMLAGSRSRFVAKAEELAELQRRLAERDLNLSAPLWGQGEPGAEGEAADWERQALADQAEFMAGLEAIGADMDRRPLWLYPADMNWQLAGDELQLSFSLPSGAFATSVLRELVCYQDHFRAEVKDADTAQ
ncbi:tRNA pseudouridine(13) synthase TruD [Gallaecimonas sp. GXIMD4217]|uniref:tRNA pseudouridine(13) synthase TruD n=1 Tax=Gallaecimonas sp. GXIMD4217 TaxID=3131927 RepID=UPI00311ABBB1